MLKLIFIAFFMLILIFTLWLLTSEHDKCYTNKEYEGVAAMNSCLGEIGNSLCNDCPYCVRGIRDE